MEEMLKVKEAQQQNRNVSILVPERDTNAKVRGRPGVKAKGKVGSRIDSGLKKPKVIEPAPKPAFGRKALAPPVKPTAKAKVSVVSDWYDIG